MQNINWQHRQQRYLENKWKYSTKKTSVRLNMNRGLIFMKFRKSHRGFQDVNRYCQVFQDVRRLTY